MRVYQLPTGEWVPSVTAVVNGGKSMPPNLSATPAMQRGIHVHEAIANRILGKACTLPDECQPYLDAVAPLLSEMEPILIENTIWHPSGYAGRFDALVRWRGKIHLIDWKTTKATVNPKKCLLQAFAYGQGVHFLYGYRPTLTIVGIGPDAAETLSFSQKESEGVRETFEARLNEAKTALEHEIRKQTLLREAFRWK